MLGVILQSPHIIMDQIIYDIFTKSQPTSVQGSIQKNSFQKKIKGDRM